MGSALVQLVSIMLGGAFGAVMRYIVANKVYDWIGRDFPYGTLAVNVAGSYLMGLLTIIIMTHSHFDQALRLGLLVGFLGAFTTFSTFSVDTFDLIEEGLLWHAFLNVFISVAACVFAVWLGVLTGRQF